MLVSFDQSDVTYKAFKAQIVSNNDKKEDKDDGVKLQTTMVVITVEESVKVCVSLLAGMDPNNITIMSDAVKKIG